MSHQMKKEHVQLKWCIALIVILAMVVMPMSAVADQQAEVDVSKLPKEAIKALYLSQQAVQEKNFDESIRVLTEYMAVAQEKIPLPVYQMLGHSYYQKEDIENARKSYKSAFEAFPANAEMLQNFAILSYETERLTEAAGLFEKLYRLKGEKDKKVLYQAAGIFFQAEKLKDTKRILTELLTSGGELNPKWYEDMIALCIELKKWREAEKWATKFLEWHPDRSEYWRLLAQVRLDREEYRPAASALEIAYRLENAKKNEWLELSDLYLYLNAPLMSIRCMKSAYGDKIPEGRKIRIAKTYARTQRFQEAVKCLNAAIEKSPTAALYYEKGRILYDAMEYEDAIGALDMCAKLDPNYGQAHILAGFAAWNLNAWEKSRSCFAKATTLPKYRDQANDAVKVLDDLMAALSEK